MGKKIWSREAISEEKRNRKEIEKGRTRKERERGKQH